MAQTIGVTLERSTSHGQARLTNDSAYAPVLDANQSVTNIVVSYLDPGGESVTCDVALYDVTDVATLADFANAPRVQFWPQLTFSTALGAAFLSVDSSINTDLSAYAGRQLAITANNVTQGQLANVPSVFSSAARNADPVALDDPYGADFSTDQGVCVYCTTETVINTPTIRKSSTFDIETILSGTVTAATLNGNAITVDSQTGTAVTLTDSGSGITTSREYDLVLTDNSADPDETITVQVNVVGLPSNTAKKDGGLLVSLTDLTLDAVNASGTVVKQLTGITTDASGVISPVDLSDISEAVGDTLKVSLHSAASDVGVTFEQALELI